MNFDKEYKATAKARADYYNTGAVLDRDMLNRDIINQQGDIETQARSMALLANPRPERAGFKMKALGASPDGQQNTATIVPHETLDPRVGEDLDNTGKDPGAETFKPLGPVDDLEGDMMPADLDPFIGQAADTLTEGAAREGLGALQGVGSGLLKGVGNTVETMAHLTGFEEDLAEFIEWTNKTFPIPSLHQPDTVAGKIAEPLAQFGGIFAISSTLLASAGLAFGMGNAMASGFITDFSAFDADDPNIADIIKQYDHVKPEIMRGIRDLMIEHLVKDPGNDTFFEKKLKDAFIGGVLGTLIDGPVLMYKMASTFMRNPSLQKSMIRIGFEGKRELAAIDPTDPMAAVKTAEANRKIALGTIASSTESVVKDARAALAIEEASSRVATIEAASTATQVERHALSLADLARELGADEPLAEFALINRKALTDLYDPGDGVSVADDLLRVITGRKGTTKGTDIGFGTFEGQMNPNVRIPLPDDMSPEERLAFLATLGEELEQKAMAASKFIPTELDAPVTEGATRTYQIVVKDASGEVDKESVAFLKSKLPDGFEVNARRAGNGYIVDIIPAFTDEGAVEPALLDLAQAMYDTGYSEEDAAVFAVDMVSDYIDSSEYKKALLNWQRGVENDAIQQIPGEIPGGRTAAAAFLRGDETAGAALEGTVRERAEQARTGLQSRLRDYNDVRGRARGIRDSFVNNQREWILKHNFALERRQALLDAEPKNAALAPLTDEDHPARKASGLLLGLPGVTGEDGVTADDIRQQEIETGDQIVAAVGPRIFDAATDAAAPIIKKLSGDILTDETLTGIREALKQGPDAELKGIDFNFENIDTTDDVLHLINVISREREQVITETKRGVRHDVDVEREANLLANEMGDATLAKVLMREEGELLNDSTIWAARKIHVAMVEEGAALAKKINQGNATEKEMIDFRRLMALTTTLHAQLKGAQTEAARTLRILQKPARAADGTAIESAHIEDIMQALGGQNLQKRHAAAFLDLMARGGTAAASVFSRKAHQSGTLDMLLEAYIAGLLFSPKTHVVNIGSNSMVQGVLNIERGIAAFNRSLIKPITGKEGVSWSEYEVYALGQVLGMYDGIRMFAKAAQTGNPSDLATKLGLADARGGQRAITSDNVAQLPLVKGAGQLADKAAEAIDSRLPGAGLMQPGLHKAEAGMGAMVDVLGEFYFRLPFRFLQAEDEFFKAMTYRAELQAQAMREIKDRGLVGEDAVLFYNNLLSDPQQYAPDVHIRAIEAAREATFTQHPGEAAHAMLRFLNAESTRPIARLVVPFFNVINNILRFTFDRLPVKYVSSDQIRKIVTGTPAERDLEIAKQVSGLGLMSIGTTLIWGTPFGLGFEGGATHAKGKARAGARIMKRNGNSLVVPWSTIDPEGRFKGILHDGHDKKYQINRMDPISTFVTMSGMVNEMMRYAENDEERENIAYLAGLALKDSMLDKTWMTSISQFFDTFGGEAYSQEEAIGKIEKFTARLGATFAVNQGFKTARDELDPVRRDTSPTNPYDTPAGRQLSRLYNEVCNRWPGCSEDLPPMVNVLGEEIVLEGGIGPDFMSPIYTNTPVVDRKTMLDAGVPKDIAGRPSYAGLEVGVDITRDELKSMIKAGGVHLELERTGMPLSMPKREWKGIRLSPEQWVFMAKMQGEAIKLELTELFKDDFYLDAPEGEGVKGSKQDLIRRVVRDTRAALDPILAETPEWEKIMDAWYLRQYTAHEGHYPLDNEIIDTLPDGKKVYGRDINPPGKSGESATPDSAVNELLRGNTP